MKNTLTPDFSKNADQLIPAIIQDAMSEQVLMLGYMNQEALDKTLEIGKVTFYSRSKKRLWTKGETSNNFLYVKDIKQDCDADTLLIKVTPAGPACHTGNDTCFGVQPNTSTSLRFLNDIIKDRKENPKEGSYTNTLLNNINKAAQKVGEEAVELVIEAKDHNRDLFLNEAADLMYHYLVLLHTKGENLENVIDVLQQRHTNP